jgi:hypothetical protein
VTVGIGNDTEILKCHKVILALASPTLNSLVEGASGELQFTNMKPKSWKSFYGCIDPNNDDKAPLTGMGQFDYLGTIAELIPWFQLFNMTTHLIVEVQLSSRILNISFRYSKDVYITMKMQHVYGSWLLCSSLLLSMI